MTDPIFEAFATAHAIGQDLDRLVDDLIAAFAPLKLEFADNEDDRAVNWSPRTYSAHLKLPSLRAASKAPAHLAIHFDLARSAVDDSHWPSARTALVVVAYAMDYASGWQGAELAVTADGRIGYEASTPLLRFAGNRLLATRAAGKGGWAQADWAFATPFAGLDEAGALKARIADPVTSLLVLGAAPEAALAKAGAVAWAEPPV